MVKIFVDDLELDVTPGENLLGACLNAGLDLPYFCWHPVMGSIGSCRQCAVVQYQNEEDTRGRIVMGCMTPVAEGARFSLAAPSARTFRAAIIESLMLNHPHDCPVCAEGGECHLQDMTVMVGHRDRRYRGRKNTYRNQYLGPLIHHEMNRCITCYRCVRYYCDYAGGSDLSAQACHDHIYFGRHRDGVLESEFAGNLVEVCPTGVFTDKSLLRHYTRKWDLQSAPSICPGCAVGCNTIPGERYGQLRRVHNRYNHEVNGYFLCDRGRFGSGYINSDRRLDFAGWRNADGTFAAIRQSQAVETAATWLKSARVAAIGSPRASLEANFLLRELVGAENFAAGFSSVEQPVVDRIAQILQATAALSPPLKQMEGADAILILGEDVTNTAPRTALALRQAVRNKAYELADQAGLLHWQDAAVRNLAQDQRSPMIIASPADTRLDDVASELISLPPDGIAGFGRAVAASLAGKPADDARAQRVAGVLKAAKNPLVISGSGLLHSGIVDSAAAVAEALVANGGKAMLGYCLAEANSLGLALLGGKSLDALLDRVEGVDALLVLENDLTRRLSASQMEKLFQGAHSQKTFSQNPHSQKTRVIALDLVETEMLEHCDLVLPAASYAESEGTLVSSEGRAQRYYPVLEPGEERLPSWRWLLQIAVASGHQPLSQMAHFDQVVAACAQSNGLFAGLTAVAPLSDYRSHGLKVPRQSHRYSGRTAMCADVSVHEPQQPADTETPLAYTMEGMNQDQPSALKPFFWSPGWNSNQSVQKFQQEVDGPLRGEAAGVRLFEPRPSSAALAPALSGETMGELQSQLQSQLQPHKWRLVPLYCIYGSEELSAITDEIAELAGRPFIAVGEVVARRLGVVAGDGLRVSAAGQTISLEVKILRRVAKNCVGFSAGYRQTLDLQPGELVGLERDDAWQRGSPRMIASDRGGLRDSDRDSFKDNGHD